MVSKNTEKTDYSSNFKFGYFSFKRNFNVSLKSSNDTTLIMFSLPFGQSFSESLKFYDRVILLIVLFYYSLDKIFSIQLPINCIFKSYTLIKNIRY